MERERFACPCCGNFTLEEKPPGTFDICPVCKWEDDRVQFDDPSFGGGANVVSLNEARANYQRLGVSDPEHADGARPPTPDELPRS